jgi:hypothetical protein
MLKVCYSSYSSLSLEEWWKRMILITNASLCGKVTPSPFFIVKIVDLYHGFKVQAITITYFS